jgi:hypothetical protein
VIFLLWSLCQLWAHLNDVFVVYAPHRAAALEAEAMHVLLFLVSKAERLLMATRVIICGCINFADVELTDWRVKHIKLVCQVAHQMLVLQWWAAELVCLLWCSVSEVKIRTS